MRGALGLFLATTWLATIMLGAAATPPEKRLSSSLNEFAVDLLRHGMAKSGNAVCSPYSVASALAMTCAAASGATAEQLARALHLPSDEVLAHYGLLHASLASLAGQPGLEWAGANRIWADRPFEAVYLKAVRKSLGAEPVRLSFARPEEARRTINDWVCQNTRQQIPELLKPPDISADTELVLSNALYFKGAWASPFKPQDTRPAEFHRADGQTPVSVALMEQEGSFLTNLAADISAAEAPDIVELPYCGSRVVMDVILPTRSLTLTQFVAGLEAPRLEGWLRDLDSAKVRVELPRFSLKHQLDLVPALRELAGPLPFSPECDLSAGLGSGGRGVQLGPVLHAARLDTDEAGSTAAAATAVVATRSAPVTFRADRPFLVILRDRETGSILFLGRVEDPTK